MYLFGIPINDICQKLANYQSKAPSGLSLWSLETVRAILNTESYTGYQFVFEKDTVMVMYIGWLIILPIIFAVAYEFINDGILHTGDINREVNSNWLFTMKINNKTDYFYACEKFRELVLDRYGE